ncbi:MAG: hypothetical protein ACAI38_14870 [Myxococcota bacterium]
MNHSPLRRLSVLLLCAACWLPAKALAIRPFVTDDARVVGARLAQLETWVRYDVQSLEHNILAAFGPTDWLELSGGLVHGAVIEGDGAGYTIKGPLLQGKVLAMPAVDNGHPGLAFAGGALFPWGRGEFREPGWGAFAYAAATQSLEAEAILIHVNLGVTTGDDLEEVNVTAGIGSQIKVLGGMHGVFEIFYGDPYAPGFALWATQVGFRYIFNASIQCDGTFGSTFTEVEGGETEQWGTLGLRIVSPELW